MSANDINNVNGTGIDNYRGGAYPPSAVATEQQRVAIFLSQALITWRYGPDGLPGAAGTEERRLGHLPRWNSKLGATNINLGIHDAAGAPYPNVAPTLAWGSNASPNYDLASLLITWAGPGFFPQSYFSRAARRPVPSQGNGVRTAPPT